MKLLMGWNWIYTSQQTGNGSKMTTDKRKREEKVKWRRDGEELNINDSSSDIGPRILHQA